MNDMPEQNDDPKDEKPEEPPMADASADENVVKPEAFVWPEEGLEAHFDGVDPEAGDVEGVEEDPLADLQDELAETKDRLLRMAAEMENLRKRSERERAEAQQFAITKFARDVLTVADHMAMALATVSQEARDKADDATKNLLAGVELTERELLQVFERHGVSRVAAEGAKFDPNFHEAMFQVPSADVEPGTVVQVVTNGFKIGDRLLRPAKVGVSTKAPDAPATDDGTASE
ncbi:MAG: nucleotide exchange factor GrpE [Alphaproteobacteria bacterium]